jgi:hypothetical protein
MYVLLFVDATNQPRYLQGTVAEINRQLRVIWRDNEIDPDEWEYRQNWLMLGVEDGRLTPMGNAECNHVPQFEVV